MEFIPNTWLFRHYGKTHIESLFHIDQEACDLRKGEQGSKPEPHRGVCP